MSLSEKILNYASVLCESAEQCKVSNEKELYDLHIKEALKWLIAIHEKQDEKNIIAKISSHSRAYGWSYLSEDSGRKAEEAFYKLKNSII